MLVRQTVSQMQSKIYNNANTNFSEISGVHAQQQQGVQWQAGESRGRGNRKGGGCCGRCGSCCGGGGCVFLVVLVVVAVAAVAARNRKCKSCKAICAA